VPRYLAIFAMLVALFAATGTGASAQVAPFCAPGERPQFLFGFALLKGQLGAIMGDPIECVHVNPVNGDALQSTTAGLSFYRASTNTPTFTDGYRHWANTPRGLLFWVGDAIDPPATAQVVSAPAPAPPAAPPALPAAPPPVAPPPPAAPRGLVPVGPGGLVPIGPGTQAPVQPTAPPAAASPPPAAPPPPAATQPAPAPGATGPASCPVFSDGTRRPTTGTTIASGGPLNGRGVLTVNNAGQRDAVFVLQYPNYQTLISAYVRAGETANVSGIPDQTYYFLYTAGDGWDCAAARFTQNVTYRRSEDTLTFVTTGTQYTEWEITLQLSSGGNSAAAPLNPGDFPPLR
jgi:hypothetical protein